jgi:hypothetical protein
MTDEISDAVIAVLPRRPGDWLCADECVGCHGCFGHVQCALRAMVIAASHIGNAVVPYVPRRRNVVETERRRPGRGSHKSDQGALRSEWMTIR